MVPLEEVSKARTGEIRVGGNKNPIQSSMVIKNMEGLRTKVKDKDQRVKVDSSQPGRAY